MGKYVKLVVLLSISIYFCVIFFVIFLSSLKFVVDDHQSNNNDNHGYDYKYIQYNPFNNDTKLSGFVTLPFRLEENNEMKLSYVEEISGDQVLISHFDNEENEYICTGSCYCEEDDLENISSSSSRRRNSLSRILTQGIRFFTIALSSTVAYSLAKDFFHEECQKKYEKECSSPSSIIRASIYSCDKNEKYDYSHLSDQEQMDIGAKMRESDRQGDYARYTCHGHCMPKKMKTKNEQKEIDKYGCDQLTFTGDVPIRLLKQSDLMGDAKYHFCRIDLEYYCVKNSETTFTFVNKVGMEITRTVPACYGGGEFLTGVYNPSVHCQRKSS